MMAKPEIEETALLWFSKIQAIQTYGHVINFKPETNYDGTDNVLLSTQSLLDIKKDRGVLEVGEVQDGIHGGEYQPTLSITIKYPDHRLLSVVRMSRVLTLAKTPQQQRHYMESLRSCLQELLRQDDHLSKTIVTVCDGDEVALETSISETINEDLKRCKNPSFSTQNIGQGLAFLYFYDQLYPVLHDMKERVNRWAHLKLLPAVVIDCSNDLATAKDERFKGIGWITIVINSSEKRQGLISSQVFQLEHDMVIVECPQPIWTLKTLHNIGKLSQKEYEREITSFRRTLNEIIAAKVDSGQIKKYQCLVYDGDDTSLADHIRSCTDEYNSHKMPVNELGDIETDGAQEHRLEADACVGHSASISSYQNLDRGRTDFVDVNSASDMKNGWGDSSVLKLVAEMKDEIVTTDVFYLTEDAEGDYGLKFSPSLEVNVSMVTDRRDDGVALNVDMIAAALKQENLISDEVKSRLTSATYSPRRQASLVLQLLLFILNLNIAIYPSLTKAFEGLKQRARQSKDGPQDGGNFNSPKGLSPEDAKPAEETAASKISKKVEAKSPKPSLKGPEAKLQIISNVLFTMIEGKNYYPYDFEVQLRKFVFENKQDVCKLRNKDGLTLLQAIVTSNRPQFFSPLFRAGCWTNLKPLNAEDGPYEGKTAEEICANARFRKVQKEMDTYTVWEKSLNQIHLAARKGDLTEVKRMLKFSQDLHNEPDSMDCTSLYWAVVGGNVDVVKLLVSLKVDHAKVNKRKETILHVACIIGHTHLLTTLVKDLRMDWTVKDAAKKSPLLRVAENGDDKSLAKLMKCGLRKDKLGPILAIAGHYGRLGFLRKVIEDQGVDPASKDDAGKSPFMRACEQGKLEVAKYLLTRNINICETDTRRRNVLHMAADGAGVEMLEFLVNEIKTRKGDDMLRTMLCQRDKYIGGELCMLIRGKDKGRDSWHYVEVCRGLMDVFMKRTRSGTIDVAKYGTLLHSGWGVDPDEESAREIEQRFETRRNASLAEDLDVTPLHIAAFKDKDDVAEMLMEKGGDVNVRDKFGLTPLHVAAMRGNLAIVKGLLKRGATTDVLDNLVKTPMDVAEDNEHREVAGFIRSSQFLPVAQNFRERILPNIQRLIGEEFIHELQESGRDVRTHLINTLRDLSIDINESLLALGSGPVLEESTPNVASPSTKD